MAKEVRLLSPEEKKQEVHKKDSRLWEEDKLPKVEESLLNSPLSALFPNGLRLISLIILACVHLQPPMGLAAEGFNPSAEMGFEPLMEILQPDISETLKTAKLWKILDT
jgi:hypothetical protein